MAKKQIFLTEKQIETIKNRLLTENRESKNMSKARNLLYQQGYSQEDAQKTIEAIRNDIPNARLADCKFLPGVTRMYLDSELSDGNAIMKLNKTLKYVASGAHVNEYDNNLNGMSVNELVQRFTSVQQQDADASRAESYNKQYTKNNAYTIVRIPDAETAAEYGNYTSWCVTHDEKMYDSYTDGGTGLFYFCLRNGFEDEQPNVGENCPLDSYGLSMIAVSVTMDGELNTCTCRWNHDNGGNDNIMDKNQLEELLGVNFYEVFKPYTREELHTRGIILFDEVPELLAQGKKPEEIFDEVNDIYNIKDNNIKFVYLNKKYNLLDVSVNKLLIPNMWFQMITNRHGEVPENVLIMTKTWGKSNFYDHVTHEWLFPDMWFDDIDTFDYTPTKWLVEKDKKANIADLEKKRFILDTWYDSVYQSSSNCEYTKVTSDDMENIVSLQTGKLVSPNRWFDCVFNFNFSEGYAIVQLNNKQNLINTNGELVWNKPDNQWFDLIWDFFHDGYAQVRLNGVWYKLRYDGVLCDYNTTEPLPNQQIVSEAKKIKRIYLTENQVAELKQKIQQARDETNTNPTEKQKEAGNYKMGKVSILGFNIAIENPKGSYRRGKNRDGKEWKTLMHNDYGYFTHTLAIDGDAVDVFLGDNLNCDTIFAIDQKINGKFDETKVMFGFKSAEEAKKAYLSNYEKGWKGFWKITEVNIDVFKKWLYDGYKQRKPFFEYTEIKKNKLNENLLKESNFDDYYEEMSAYDTLNQFVDDMNNGRQTQNWAPLINPAMYQKALQIFTKQGNLDGFPEKYIYQWIGIIMRNTIQLDINTQLAGHAAGYPLDDFSYSNINEYIKQKLGFTVLDWDSPHVTLEITPQYLISFLQHEHLSPAEQEYVDTYLENNKINENAIHKIGDNKGQMTMFLSQPELDYYDNEKALRTRVNNIQGLIDIFNEHNKEHENRANFGVSDDILSVNEKGRLLMKMDLSRLLDMVGFYDWMQMPDGSDAWSDYGLYPLFEILQEYDDNTSTPEQTLVLINRALDVSHPRGDMASIFIEGGSRTLTQISNTGYVNENICNETSTTTGNRLRYLQDWQIEDIQKNTRNGFIKLYHNTSGVNLGDILISGELDTHQKHSEGHGHMLFFTVNPDAWGHECKISIEVPVEEFENGNFRFVNDDSVTTENNIPINAYNFKIENVRHLDYNSIVEILTGDNIRMKEYLLLKYFQEYDYMWWIKQWFLNYLGLKEEDLL